MKKLSILFLLMIGLGLGFTSCEKDDQDEWERYYGFTKEAVLGQYEANPDDSYYPELPTEGVTVYRQVSITISGLSGDLISLRISIPNVINKVFSGVISPSETASDLILTNHSAHEDIMMTVYKNAQNQIRMHGRARHYYTDQEGNITNSDIYGFDVLKQATE